MSEIREHDMVRITRDLPVLGLEAGTEVVVVFVYETPTLAYEVEQVGEGGRTLFLGTVEPQYVERISDGYGNP